MPLQFGAKSVVQFSIDIFRSVVPAIVLNGWWLAVHRVGNRLAGTLQMFARALAVRALWKRTKPRGQRLQLALDFGAAHLMMQCDALHLAQKLFVSTAYRICERQHDIHFMTRFLDKLCEQFFDILRKPGH